MSNTPSTIKILSVNVGRSSTAQLIALQNALDARIDFLLIQEPHISSDTGRRITCKHPSFECYSPVDEWSIRPRVITYAKRNTNIIHYQEQPISSTEQGIGDNLCLSVKAPNNPRLLIINAYNAPPRSTNPGAGVSRLISIADVSLPRQTILMGDLNLHHPMWHPSFRGSPSPPSEAFTRWLESCGLFLISEIDRPTHNRGNVLDLCFGSSQLVAKGTIATVQENLDVTSDNLPLLTTVHCGARGNIPRKSLRFATVDKDTFILLLAPQLEGILPLTDESITNIDRRAEKIIRILHVSFAGSAKRALPHNR